MYAALRACWMPPPKDLARHGMEYTVRFAFKRDGEIVAPPRVTYSSHDAPAEVRDIYRDAVNAALRAARRCISATAWVVPWRAARSPSVSWTTGPSTINDARCHRAALTILRRFSSAE